MSQNRKQRGQGETMRKPIMELLRCQSGATAIEYGLVCILISLVVVSAVTAIGTRIAQIFNNVAAGF